MNDSLELDENSLMEFAVISETPEGHCGHPLRRYVQEIMPVLLGEVDSSFNGGSFDGYT